MIIKNGIGLEKEKMLLGDFESEKERLQLVLNDYGKSIICRRLPFFHVQDVFRQFSSAGITIFKNGSNKSYVCLPTGLLKRVRGIM